MALEEEVEISKPESFPLTVPKKKWTRNKRYKKWVKTLKKKTAEIHHTASEDICVGKHTICEGDLGIPRKYMPQFNNYDEINHFTSFIKEAYNIKSALTSRKAIDLHPSQGEISRKRIDEMIAKKLYNHTAIVPLVISKDNYIVDGHHRWAVYRFRKPKTKIPVVLIKASIKDILGIAVAWGAKHQHF